MYDSGKIIAGLVVFFLLFTSPLWVNFGKTASVPERKLDTPVIQELDNPVCVKENMANNHMQVLDLWRDSVVRDADRTAVGFDGTIHEMSLSNTCMECHSNKADFCDKCHTYAGVDPFCWDCHVEPKEEPSHG